MVFKSLSKDFSGFWATYTLDNRNLTLTQLIRELQCYDLMLNGGQPIRRAEANIVVASSLKGKGKHAKKGNAKVSRPPQVERKRTKKPKGLYKSKCFFYSKKGHFKGNCKEWKEYLDIKGKCMKLFMIEACEGYDRPLGH
ncbi:hypothetical protein PVK06_034838 [Gossypium arboreum]|uniref:Gag/pol protein n=1 Tax=Gossypium arboreum TaxID=29729 RepID=A0ABR0NF89_GOSAR|nr:hypothetical protein PVK06_034838 [Gossypium arboreum]